MILASRRAELSPAGIRKNGLPHPDCQRARHAGETRLVL
jgi:hypothetical protein